MILLRWRPRWDSSVSLFLFLPSAHLFHQHGEADSHAQEVRQHQQPRLLVHAVKKESAASSRHPAGDAARSSLEGEEMIFKQGRDRQFGLS